MSSRQAATWGAAIHALFAAIIFYKLGDVLADHDGLHFAALTNDPLLLDSPTLDYITYRAMRIGMPLLAWPLSILGADIALALVQVAAVGVGVWAAGNLAVRRGKSAVWGLAFAVFPGTLVSTRTLVADAVAAAFMLAAVDSWERGRRGWVWAVLAVLSKETMLLAVAGYAFFDWRRAVAPFTVFGLWTASLLARFGWDSPGNTIGPPLKGAWEAWLLWWWNLRWDEMIGGFVVVAVVVVVAVYAWTRRTPITFAALGVCAIVPLLGVRALEHAIHSQRFILFPLTVAVLLWRTREGQPTRLSGSPSGR